MKILILNWRDIKNPTSGGAEILTHEMAKRWVEDGHEVTQFSSVFNGALKTETVDGVKFIRDGKADVRYFFDSVHFKAFLSYQRFFKGKFDVVIDEIHGIPFFTPLYVKEKKIALICEIAGRIWDVNFPFPFNIIGKFVERNYFKFYKNIKFLTISDSTKKELNKFGVENKNIVVLPMGISMPQKLPKKSKEENFTLIFVARLLKAKGIEDAIKILDILKNEFPHLRLWVIGRGEKNYGLKLRKMIYKLKLKERVKFFGFISQSKKFELMQRAHILVAPSIKEGFGLTVPEAGIVGTPVVAYDVEGLKEIVRGNGILVRPNGTALADGVKKILKDEDLYKKIQNNAIEAASRLNWDKTAETALAVFKDH